VKENAQNKQKYPQVSEENTTTKQSKTQYCWISKIIFSQLTNKALDVKDLNKFPSQERGHSAQTSYRELQ